MINFLFTLPSTAYLFILMILFGIIGYGMGLLIWAPPVLRKSTPPNIQRHNTIVN